MKVLARWMVAWILKAGVAVTIAAVVAAGVIAGSAAIDAAHAEVATVPAASSPASETLRCSFCGKSKAEVETLIAGPGVYICNECVALSNDIIDEKRGITRLPRSARGVSGVLIDLLIQWTPMLLLIGVWIFFMRRMNTGRAAEDYRKERQRLHLEQVEIQLKRVADLLEQRSDQQ